MTIEKECDAITESKISLTSKERIKLNEHIFLDNKNKESTTKYSSFQLQLIF